MNHLTTQQISDGFSRVLESPKDAGTLEAIVIRPASGQRERPAKARLTAEGGVEGDRWAATSWLKLPDGRPDPRVQVAVMNARILRLLAGDEERISLAGDNLIVDFDLSEANVPVGQKLAVGEVVIQVSDQAHTGCGKFQQRYGKDAVQYINAPRGRSLRLRGLFASIVQGGTVREGDSVRKLP
jgi:MOSC domain-containing protein YiiM